MKLGGLIKGIVRAAGALVGSQLGGPLGAAAGGLLATKLTGGSTKDALGAGLVSGLGAYALPKGASALGLDLDGGGVPGNISANAAEGRMLNARAPSFIESISQSLGRPSNLAALAIGTAALQPGETPESPTVPPHPDGEFQFDFDASVNRQRRPMSGDPYAYGESGQEPMFYADGGPVDTESVVKRMRLFPAFDPFTYGEGPQASFYAPMATSNVNDETDHVDDPAPPDALHSNQLPAVGGNNPIFDSIGGGEGRSSGGSWGDLSMHDLAGAYDTLGMISDPFGIGVPVGIGSGVAMVARDQIDKAFERADRELHDGAGISGAPSISDSGVSYAGDIDAAHGWGGDGPSADGGPDVSGDAGGAGYARGGAANPRSRMMRPSDMARAAARGRVAGPGGGQDDKVPAMLSDGEYVLDADLVSSLGDGSNDAGARKLDEFRNRVRKHKRGTSKSKIPPKAKGIGSYMRGGV